MKTKNFLIVFFIFSFIICFQIAWHIHLLQKRIALLEEVNALEEQRVLQLEDLLSEKEGLLELQRENEELLKEKVLLLESQNVLLLEGITFREQSFALCSERASVLERAMGEFEVGLGACQVQLIECLTPPPAEDPAGTGDGAPLGAPEELHYWF